MTPAPASARLSWPLRCERVAAVRSGRRVLRDLSLEVRAGETLSIIGPNGAGKTSLLLLLSGLLRPCEGTVRAGGLELSYAPARKRARFASYLPQNIDSLPAFCIYDVVASGRYARLRPMRPPTDADRNAVDAALHLCGLTPLADRPINQVSGGERQKALLAAALAQDAPLLLLDEPTTALDPAVQIELVRLLRDWRNPQRSLVVVSHDLQLPAALGGRVLAMRDGTIVADEPAGRMLDPDRLAGIFQAHFTRATAAGGDIILPDFWHIPA